MKKPIKIIAAIIAIVFAFGQMAYPAPHSALRPIATAERKKAIFEEEAIPAVSAAILSISEFSELREALTKGAKEADLRELEEKIIEKAILAAKAQIECDAKIARLHYDVIELGKRRQTRIVQSDRPVDTKDMLTPQLLRKIKQAAADEGIDLCIDTHLMIMNTSEECIQDYIKAGSDYIILHWEGFRDKDLLAERLNFIRDKGCRAGLSCNPRESMKKITEFLARADVKDKLDIFQQMTTYSGRGGQKFIARTLLRIHKLREILPEDVLIQADGGIDPLYSAEQALQAGADFIFSGYAFFG